MKHSLLFLATASVLLSACADTVPDYRIKIVHDTDKTIAVPAPCRSWEEGWGSPVGNETWPSFGCSQAKNLAAQVEDPLDLIEGRDLASPEPVNSTASIYRYQSGETTPLTDPLSDKPLEIRKLKDTRVGGAPTK
jgi:type IV pilus biogenesis protein CpaD/CtpE